MFRYKQQFNEVFRKIKKMLELTNHQFKNHKFYIPKHDLKYLFVGTFNPEYGRKVPYYYGRKSNYFWKIISNIFNVGINPFEDNFFKKLEDLKIGCIDIVDSVIYEKEKYHSLINGKGYSDEEIFKKKNNITINYNTQQIIDLVKKNNLKKIYITNKGDVFRKEQKLEIKKIKNYCDVIYISSPSQYNVHKNSGIDKLVKNWRFNLEF